MPSPISGDKSYTLGDNKLTQSDEKPSPTKSAPNANARLADDSVDLNSSNAQTRELAPNQVLQTPQQAQSKLQDLLAAMRQQPSLAGAAFGQISQALTDSALSQPAN